MIKISKILILSLFIIMFLMGCSNKNDNKNSLINNKNIKDNTKVSNLSESFAKYSELKSKQTEVLTDMSQESDSYLLSMALIPFAMSDLTILPASICGLDESVAASQLFLFSNVKYSMEKDTCTVTYTAGEDETTSKFVATYDKKTDSVTMSVYEDNVLTVISEYVKIPDGYASQFYTIEEGEDTVTVYKSLFENSNIYTSIFENSKRPESIFRKNNIDIDFAKNGDYLYIEVVNGVPSGILQGETLNFNN